MKGHSIQYNLKKKKRKDYGFVPLEYDNAVADPGISIRGGAKFEIFSVRGGGGGWRPQFANQYYLSFQNMEFAFQ